MRVPGGEGILPKMTDGLEASSRASAACFDPGVITARAAAPGLGSGMAPVGVRVVSSAAARVDAVLSATQAS